ncbi:MAG: hypothetical protein J0H09_01935, partial [Burkholderiales bacterium]|nr:hypothetical protein [Burkholderiales bacterium]
MKKETSGVLVLSNEGQTLFSSALAQRPDVAAALLAHWRKPDAAQPGLFGIETEELALSVVSVSSPQASVFVVFERGANDVLFDF